MANGKSSMSRLLAITGIAGVIFLSGCGSSDKRATPEPSSEWPPKKAYAVQSGEEANQPSQQSWQHSRGKHLIPATVISVTDGDTVNVRLPTGAKERVRLIGVNAPESTKRVEPYGYQAAAYTRKALNGREIYLEMDVQDRDKYGRLLAYIWLAEPRTGNEAEVREKMFNARLLLEGYAQVMTVPPNVKYADLFRRFQAEARQGNKGLWNP